jgi:lipoyl-dependent peroxiredoxin
MTAKRTATAVWEHDLAKGQGRVKGTSGAINELAYTWASRTEAPGGKTSPEELLAAAHAACFAMALTANLGRANKASEQVSVAATATFDKVGDAWKVTTMEIDATAKVPGLAPAEFAEIAKKAEAGCPISVALRGNVEIKVSAKLA